MKKHLKQVRELAEQHATDSKKKKKLTRAALETLADEAYWNVVFPLLENRGADTEGKIEGATLEQHYTRTFVEAYLAKPSKSKAKPKAKAAKPRAPVRALTEDDDPTGATLRAVVRYVESGADINALLDDGEVFMESLLHLAATNHHVAIMKYLLEAGADPEIPNGTTGEQPLHLAVACKDDPAPIALLLEHGADPNIASRSGSLALHDAIMMGHAKIVKLLIARGADPKLTIRYENKDCDAFALCKARGVTLEL